ncbi:MAG TPA: hypothetical protein VFR75_08105 [Solirubrobacterales bacterium]|nr:hypothetical protein [Solirubrobacterales bacterium]
MTEAARAKRRPGAAPVFWTSMALFCVLLGLLTYRFSIGKDPSGVAPAAAPAKKAPARKVIVRRVVTTVVPAGSGAATGSGGEAPAVSEAAPEAESIPVSEPVTSSS